MTATSVGVEAHPRGEVARDVGADLAVVARPRPCRCRAAARRRAAGRGGRRGGSRALAWTAVSTRWRSTVKRCTALRCGAERTTSQSGMQPGDQRRLVQGLPDRRPWPARRRAATRRLARLARPRHGSGGLRGQPLDGVRRQRQPGLRGRGRGAQQQARVVRSGLASRASTTSPSCSTTPSASGQPRRRAARRQRPEGATRCRPRVSRSTRCQVTSVAYAMVRGASRRPAAGRRRRARRRARRRRRPAPAGRAGRRSGR